MADRAEQVNEAMRRSTKEWRDAWPLDPHRDPWSVPLAELDPAHPALFKANTALPWFERLRAESPVHWCEESQFGPYWSLTRYDDVKYVDTHHGLFSSDIMNGGIRLGGRKPFGRILRRDGHELLVQRKLIGQCFAKVAIVIDNQDLARSAHARFLD